ncbi:MAG: hypothetical protein ACYC27_09885 [Armatimonadota bacterium]
MRFNILAVSVMLGTLFYTCVSADIGIQSMFDGKQIIEIGDTRQLTTRDDGRIELISMSPDGKSIAYIGTRGGMPRLSVTTPAGGKPVILLDTWQYQREITKGEEIISFDYDQQYSISWSPDSKTVAIPVTMTKYMANEAGSNNNGIFLINKSGVKRGFISLPDNTYRNGPIVWSPSSRRIAVLLTSVVVEDNKPKHVIKPVIFDLLANGRQTIIPCSDNVYKLKEWTADGKGLICEISVHDYVSLIEYPIDGGPARVIEEKVETATLSPDKQLELLKSKPGISFLNRSTKETIEAIKFPAASFGGWSPNGRIFAFYKPDPSIEDDAGKRSSKNISLWLALPRKDKYNDMHICSLHMNDVYFWHNYDKKRKVEWTPDGSVFAYISNGYLHTVNLVARDPQLSEKIAMGIPLTESEMQTALLSNIKQIGTSLMMYASDWDNKLPGADTFEQDLSPYLKNNDVFNYPGGQDSIFEYQYQGNMSSITDPAGTPLGRIDVGYGWYAEVYADGHAKIVEK